jgi:cytochrome oxidase Cu insertion factor (SCO1/SenC/PrrC family)
MRDSVLDNPNTRQLVSRNLRTVAALAAVFLLPLLLAFVMYYGNTWRPAARTNHGELLNPVRQLPPTANLFKDKWTLVYVGNGACDEVCRRSLYFMRQTRLSLNNEMSRVERVFLATGACCDRQFLEREHAGLIVVDATTPELRTLLNVFPPTDQKYSLFIVDPLGNLVMRYDTRDDPKGLLTDLKKLLRLSHIG